MNLRTLAFGLAAVAPGLAGARRLGPSVEFRETGGAVCPGPAAID